MTEPGRRKQFVKALASFSPTVYPREVVKRALELSATAVILVHKRPTRNLAILLEVALRPLSRAKRTWRDPGAMSANDKADIHRLL